MFAKLLLVAALLSSAAIAHAGDPALPAAQRALVEKHGAIQQPIVYVPPSKTVPARWIVFVGTATAPALSAWIVTPGAGANVVNAIGEWPNAVRVIGVTQGALPAGMTGAGEAIAFVVVESLAAVELGQPSGIRTVLAIDLPSPGSVASATIEPEALPFLAGVKDASESAARLADYGKAVAADTSQLAATDLRALVAAARKSDKQLAKLVPTAGIAVLETWQGKLARESGRIVKLDKSADVKRLRTALAETTAEYASCGEHKCGDLILGIEHGHVVIRAILVAVAPAVVAGARHAVPPSAKDTQTLATAAALDTSGSWRSEAPLGPPGATIGVVGKSVITRDGGYAKLDEIYEDGADIRYADLDGDGLTDVLAFKTHSQFILSNTHDYIAPQLELLAVGAKTADDALTAVLAIPDEGIAMKAACGILAQAKTVKGLAGVLAPDGVVFGYAEPGQPSIEPHDAMTGKDAAAAFKGKCPLASCSARLPVCESETEGPSTDYFQFVRVKGAWKLRRAAFYHGG